MIKKFTSLLAISSAVLLGSCATSNQTVQQADQNDDVYYSVAKAKEEVEVIAQAKPETSTKNDYVTEDELYRDGYGDTYSGDYAERIYRFRNYAPWRGYYNNLYSYNDMYGYNGMYSFYDPFYNPYSFYGGPGLNISIGLGAGYFGYNPWRYYGNSYYGNFWGPYSYYNSWNPYGIGYGGGYYGGGYGIGRPGYASPNYRPRPGRSSDYVPGRGAVIGRDAGGVIRNGNGNGDVIERSGSRAERYNGGNGTRPATSGTTRPQNTAPRPERVSQARPERSSPPPRVNTTPSNNNTGGGGGGGRSSGGNSGGGGGGRPSRAN